MTAGALVRLAIAILLLSAAEPAAAASRYRAIELGILPGTNSNTSAFSINEAGQIVGASWTPDGDYHACLWENGTITDLGTLPGYSGSSAYAINEAGQIVGSSGTGGSDDHWHACLWEDGTITDLGTLPGAERSAAYGVNNSGQIVGWSDVEPFGQHACLWEDGTITDLGTLPGCSGSSAYAIDEAGQIVGASWTPDGDYHACLWQDGTITDLGTLPGYSGSSAYAINEAGQIVGSSGTGGSDDYWHACLWEDGTITDLGTLPGAERSAAYGVNNSGQIVGWSDVEPFGQHACLWEDGTITDLGTLSASPWECNCSIAEDISDLGQIVGSSGSASGFPRACLWQRAISFPDVSGDFWAYDEIMACVDAKVVNGYEDGLYHPEYEVTRDQMAVYIARALVIPSGDAGIPDGPATPTFPDVPANHWAYKQIEYAVSQGVVQGYEDGTYHPEYEVTRDQMAVYVARSMVAPTGEAALADYVPADPRNFPDVPSEFWAWKHVEYCVENGVVQGYEDGLYHPEIVVTRDQMAVYVARAFGLAM